MKLVIAVAGFNASHLADRCIRSIKRQKYKNFICYITDDMSTDDTTSVINRAIAGDSRFKLIINTEKRNQCGNYDLICRNTPDIDDEDVVIEVDLDDYLPDENVFTRIDAAYQNSDVWITNGSFILPDDRMGFSSEVTDFDNIRHLPYTASHIRTWKVFLWRAIPESNLKNENNNWWGAAGDLIFMVDMLEMAGLSHYKFLPEINYVYDENNPLNDSKVNYPTVLKMIEYIKSKPKLNRLIR